MFPVIQFKLNFSAWWKPAFLLLSSHPSFAFRHFSIMLKFWPELINSLEPYIPPKPLVSSGLALLDRGGRRTGETGGGVGDHSTVHPHKLPLFTCVGLWGGGKQRRARTQQRTHRHHSPKPAYPPGHANCGKASGDLKCFKLVGNYSHENCRNARWLCL